jgi:tungstate transport system permease protein
MQIFADALREGWVALASGDVDVWVIVITSLRVSLLAVAIALVIGIPVGLWVGVKRFIGWRAALIIFNSGMGLPPVVVGLLVAMTLSRRGPLGFLDMLYSREAIVLAQVIISVPVVLAITAAAVGSVPRELRLQARSLGASSLRVSLLTLSEARMGLLAAVAGGFGAIISEVGAATMVGGNLAGETRVMTTAMVQYTRMGRYGPALALAVILMAIVVGVNVIITSMQTSAEKWEADAR